MYAKIEIISRPISFIFVRVLLGKEQKRQKKILPYRYICMPDLILILL